MKSRLISMIFLLVFLGIEIFNFVNNYTGDSFESLRSRFWLIHMGTAFVYIVISTFILKDDLGYYDLLIFFLPIVGCTMLLCENIFSVFKGRIKNSIEEAYNMEKYIKDDIEEEMILQNELNIIGAYDSLTVKTPEEKKKFIFEFNPPNIAFKIEILEKALRDEDINVIHYATVELNRIDVEFQNNIKEMEKKGDSLGIYQAYKRYIDSGILKDFMLEFYLEKSLNLLSKLVEENKELKVEILDITKRLNKKDEYEKILGELVEEKQEVVYIKEMLEFLYLENRYEEMLNFYRKYRDLNLELPDIFNGEVERWP